METIVLYRLLIPHSNFAFITPPLMLSPSQYAWIPDIQSHCFVGFGKPIEATQFTKMLPDKTRKDLIKHKRLVVSMFLVNWMDGLDSLLREDK